MHELSICQGLLREVDRVAAEHRARRVVRIEISVGPLSGVEIPLLERAFTVARAGTIAETAELAARATPVRVWCPDCELETDARANRVVCGACGNWRVQLRSGDELLLRRLSFETDDEADDDNGMSATESGALTPS